ncbi:class I SAM-dependent methyltransferase [Lentisphaerota bacterium ZTH]|nr:class I SAM-dependent methyltransferase [Lentisphaerota bacterium]WET07504.1 class I SAM-dependent methyltransferase [Lentisphaerota bacterium ZTH]
MTNSKNIISHGDIDQDFSQAVDMLKRNILDNNDTTFASVDEQLQILEDLTKFEAGRFLIKNNGGFNGFWTHYMLQFPENSQITNKSSDGSELTELESFIFSKGVITLATQQRYRIFLEENNKCVRENAELACIPGGLLGELLYLDFSKIKNIALYGIDLDEESLKYSIRLAEKMNLAQFTHTMHCDAWELPCKDKFDLVSSNGLNIYESDKARVSALYQAFYNSLKPNGKLVTSYIAYPPGSGELCEWDMSKIDCEALKRGMAIFTSVLGSIWQNFSTRSEMETMLNDIGYKDIKFIYDKAKIFPTVVAYKR